MLSWTAALSIVFLVGVAFDQFVLLIVHSGQPPEVRTVALAIFNDLFVLLILAVCYFVDGFVTHGDLGEGWLDWTLLVAAFAVGYLPVTLFSLIRLITLRS